MINSKISTLIAIFLLFLCSFSEFFNIEDLKKEQSKFLEKYNYSKIDTSINDNLSMYEFQEFSWHTPSASHRGNYWLFDLFTPPQIFLYNGKFSASLPSEPQKIADLSIVSISKQKYKVQFSGYFQKPDGVKEANKFTLMLYDIQKNHSFRCEVGDNLKEQNITIAGFEEKSPLPDPSLKNEPVITIHDHALDKTIHLSRHTKFYDDKYVIVIRANSTANTFTLTEINDSFRVKKITYSLAEINIKSDYIKFIQTAPNGHKLTLMLPIKNLLEKTLHEDGLAKPLTATEKTNI
ncbi:MAG: hypothetical protein LBH49_01310 [Puniceicoccales bacterium]|jgi:hypothetical protein|nr:hypothetical protein [Puniceicoccales bacterium]